MPDLEVTIGLVLVGAACAGSVFALIGIHVDRWLDRKRADDE